MSVHAVLALTDGNNRRQARNKIKRVFYARIIRNRHPVGRLSLGQVGHPLGQVGIIDHVKITHGSILAGLGEG